MVERLQQALDLLGRTLADRDLSYAIVIAGGAALLMRGELERPTQDVDVVSVAEGDAPFRISWTLPEPLRQAAEDVASVMGLASDWLNAGAVGIVGDRLPDGYAERVDARTYGSLVVCVLSRMDLLRLKVWAAADESPFGRHVLDIRGMRPTPAELENAFDWAREYARASSADVEAVAQALEGGEAP